MGKINTYKEVEVIPLDTNSNLDQSTSRPKPGLLPTPRMHRIPYISDHTLVPRVQKYLEANVDKTYIDINVMADELQRTYKEYSKRKRSAFRGSVKKAYSIVMHSYGHNEPQNSSSEDLSEDSQGEDEARYHDNSLNNQLMELYGRNLQKGPVDASELIDISSDDSNDDSGHKKSSNGPSTSQKDELAALLPQHLCEAELKDKSKQEQRLLNATANVRGKKRKFEGQVYAINKKKKNVANFEESLITFKDIGGIDSVLEEVCKLLVHMKHPVIYKQIGISPPRGFLLHGPPGCGKTLLANAIAGELEVPLLKVSAPELVAGVSGESEERIRELFEKAMVSAPCVLFIDEIDAITPNRQNAHKEMERRIVAQLLSCLDDLNKSDLCDQVMVIGATNRPDSLDPALRRAGRFDREVCLGIPDVKGRLHILKVLTSKLKLGDSFDFETIAKYTPGFVGADLLAATREAAMAAVNRVFNELKENNRMKKILAMQKKQEEDKKEKEKEVTDSDDKSEVDIVDVETNSKPEEEKDKNISINSSDNAVVIIDDDVKDKANSHVNSVPLPETVNNLEDFKPKTVLEELVSWLHGDVPLKLDQLTDLCITMEDFGAALKNVQPSAKREGFATVPDTTWDDVGSLGDVRQELQMAILAPVRHADQFRALGLTTPTGVLLCGPPGCGKTLLAKAIANEAGINFLSVKGPELLNMYVGESERAVRVCFQRARNSAPCVIFFDELDALCPKRSDSGEGGASMRVVNQMLTEMDGVEGRQGVFLLAASNRPDIIDPAVLRPGRLDKILYVGLPSASDRVDILRTITKGGKRPLLAPDVDIEIIGKSDQCEGYTGADLAALVREAGVEALKEYMLLGDPQKTLMVSTEHFKRAVVRVRPSVTEKDQKHYEKLKKQYGAKAPDNEVEEMEYP